MAYAGLIAETLAFTGHGGATGEAYYSRPLGDGPYPGVVVIHHLPGWDEWSIEVTRKLAHHGIGAIAPNLYFRAGPGSPDDQAARVRAQGGDSDDQVIGDIAGAMAYLRRQPQSNGKVGVIGFCSGGRYSYLAACRIPQIDAVVDCWGGRVLVDDPSTLTPKRPVAVIDLSENIRAPLLGLFGNDDKNPSPVDVNRTEEVLKRLGKTYEFHRYDGAGHAFFHAYRPSYRAEQATDGWNKVIAFFSKHLGGCEASR
jgi:carboxymethylenebutenolidase